MGAADHRPPARAISARPPGTSPDRYSARDAGPPSASQQSGPDVTINSDRLRYEMAIRGITAGELARLAEVNKNTITRALAGGPVSRRTLRELSRALLMYPTLRMADVLPEEAAGCVARSPSLPASTLRHDDAPSRPRLSRWCKRDRRHPGVVRLVHAASVIAGTPSVSIVV
jgi:hypothetical protein